MQPDGKMMVGKMIFPSFYPSLFYQFSGSQACEVIRKMKGMMAFSAVFLSY
jgi:hypothetical protein